MDNPQPILQLSDLSVGELFLDIGIVLFFIVLGGIFVAAEIALISLRDSQVRQLAIKGKRGAKVAELVKNPNRFLAAVQVGVTFSGFLSAALGAERIGKYVKPVLQDIGVSENTPQRFRYCFLQS